MKRVGLWLAITALMVNAPRLVLVYLEVDGLALWPAWEAALLIVTALATGAVLSGGGAYIAHTLASHRAGGAWRALLALIWLAMLGFSVVLIAPLMAVGIRKTDLVEILNTDRLQWFWSVTAVLAVEVLAAGAMIADALSVQPDGTGRNRTAGPNAAGLIAGALTRRLVASIEPADRTAAASDGRPEVEPDSVPDDWRAPIERAREARATSKTEAMNALLGYLADNPDASLTEAGRVIGRSKSTVGGYVDELSDAGRLAKNGHGWEVL